jgi:energy-converting hydrogenase Eha subunit F
MTKSTLFQRIDIFGTKPELFIQHNSQFKTNIGAIFTIMCYILALVCFIIFGLDLAQRVNPSILFTKMYQPMPEAKYDNFLMMLAPTLEGGVTIKDIDMKLKYYFRYTETNGQNTTQTIIPSVPCVETKFYKENRYNVQDHLYTNASNYQCLPDDFNHTLKGRYGSNMFTLYEFVVE